MKKTITPSIDNQGSALVIALLLIFAIGIISSTVVTMSSTDLKISGNQKFMTEALFAAEAGLTEAMHRVSMQNPTLVDIGGNLVNLAIEDGEPYNPNWRVYIRMETPPADLVLVGGPKSGIYTTGTVQDLSDPLQYTRATGTDDMLTVEHKWEDRNGDGLRDPDEVVLYDPTRVPAMNFTSGRPVEIVTVSGRSGTAIRSIQAEIARAYTRVQTTGALVSDQSVDIGGNAKFCGWNHKTDTPVGIRPVACFAYHEVDGGLPGVATTGDPITQKTPQTSYWGDPVASDSTTTGAFPTLNEALGISASQLAEILADADFTATGPKQLHGITYIQGDASFVGNVEGSGLIYVTGYAHFGNIKFKGLIYVEGAVRFNGNTWVLGSIMNQGPIEFTFSGKGGGTVLYSSHSLISALSSTMPVVMLSWSEM